MEKRVGVISIPINQFIEEIRLKKYSEATISSYRESLRQFESYLTINKVEDIRNVTIEIINSYKMYLQQKGSNPNTLHLKLRAIKRLFEYLEKTNQLLINPCQKLIMPKLGNRLPKNILTKEEVKRILITPNTSLHTGIRDRALIETLYSTGIRLSECINLNVYDIDYEGGHLRVNNGKGAKDRIIPLGKIACQWLKEYLTKVRPFHTLPEERSLWMGQTGEPIKPIWLNRLLNQYARKAGITKPVTVHTFRRTFATHMLQEGANPYYIQKLLGHEDSSTLNRYIKLVPKEVKEAHRKYHPRERDARHTHKICGISAVKS